VLNGCGPRLFLPLSPFLLAHRRPTLFLPSLVTIVVRSTTSIAIPSRLSMSVESKDNSIMSSPTDELSSALAEATITEDAAESTMLLGIDGESPVAKKPQTGGKRPNPVELVPHILKDLDMLTRNSPLVKLEAIRTVTRYVQLLLSLWNTTHHHPDFKGVVDKWVDLLTAFRESQKLPGSTAGYSLMTDNEITDW